MGGSHMQVTPIGTEDDIWPQPSCHGCQTRKPMKQHTAFAAFLVDDHLRTVNFVEWNMLISFLFLLCSILCCWDLRQIIVMTTTVDWLTSFTMVINTKFTFVQWTTKWVRLLVPLLYCNYNVMLVSTNSIVSTVSPWPPLDRLFFPIYLSITSLFCSDTRWRLTTFTTWKPKGHCVRTLVHS